MLISKIAFAVVKKIIPGAIVMMIVGMVAAALIATDTLSLLRDPDVVLAPLRVLTATEHALLGETRRDMQLAREKAARERAAKPQPDVF
jgi:hypothetical protein